MGLNSSCKLGGGQEVPEEVASDVAREVGRQGLDSTGYVQNIHLFSKSNPKIFKR